MKRKYKIILTVLVINFTIFCLCTNVTVKAQHGPYSIGISEDNEFVWEVKYLNLDLFERVLGYEPNFKVGDQIKVVVKSVNFRDVYWAIDMYLWDYQTDWSQEGSREFIQVFEEPSAYEHSIFLPIPIEDYLLAVWDLYQTEYNVDGATLSEIVRSETESEYLHEKTYNNKGVLLTETIYEYVTDRMIVMVEGTFFMIPMGIYFIGFTFIAIMAVIIISIRRKKLLFKNF